MTPEELQELMDIMADIAEGTPWSVDEGIIAFCQKLASQRVVAG